MKKLLGNGAARAVQGGCKEHTAYVNFGTGRKLFQILLHSGRRRKNFPNSNPADKAAPKPLNSRNFPLFPAISRFQSRLSNARRGSPANSLRKFARPAVSGRQNGFGGKPHSSMSVDSEIQRANFPSISREYALKSASSAEGVLTIAAKSLFSAPESRAKKSSLTGYPSSLAKR